MFGVYPGRRYALFTERAISRSSRSRSLVVRGMMGKPYVFFGITAVRITRILWTGDAKLKSRLSRRSRVVFRSP
jgi:hypothetical protein